MDCFSVLVTLLVGWNIVQYIFAKSLIRQIAREVSKTVAKEAAKELAEDINHIFEGNLLIQAVSGAAKPGSEMKELDSIFRALDEYSKCHYETSAQSSVDAALLNLQRRLLRMKDKGGLRVLEGKRPSYILTLAKLSSHNLPACSELLYAAEEKAEDYDKKILTPEDRECLRINGILG